MSVKRATFGYLVIIAILIVIVVIGRAALPSEYFGKDGLLTARYAFAIETLIQLLYTTPLFMLAMYLVKAGEQITLKKAIVILVVSEVTLFWGLPAALSLVPQEYVLFALKKLASFGLQPPYYNSIGYKLGVSMGIVLGLVPIGIFFIAFMGAGKDTKDPNSQGVFDLHIKAGPRWFGIAFPGAFGLFLAYGPFTISMDSNPVIFLGICALITMFIWHVIYVAMLRLRYDDEHIIVKMMLAKEREHRWADLLKIKAPKYSSRKFLIFNTGTVRIEENLEGYDNLMEHANKVLNDA